jgi:hypothetical protein
MQSVFKQVVGAFERSSGHTPIIEYATMGTIHQSCTPSRFVGVPPASMLRV